MAPSIMQASELVHKFSSDNALTTAGGQSDGRASKAAERVHNEDADELWRILQTIIVDYQQRGNNSQYSPVSSSSVRSCSGRTSCLDDVSRIDVQELGNLFQAYLERRGEACGGPSESELNAVRETITRIQTGQRMTRSVLQRISQQQQQPQRQSQTVPLEAVSPSWLLREGLYSNRILVTGATGLLGREVMKSVQEKGWNVRGLGFSRATGNIVRCDLLNRPELKNQFESFRPTIVIHCAAERRPDVVEKDEAYAIKINVDLSRDLAELCNVHGAWLIYLSTNYVFDGKEAPYAEDAKPNPINTYGRSKHLGEQVVLQAHPEAAILRVPLLYGPIEKLGETSITWLLESMMKAERGVSQKFDNWQERFPTSTEDLARVIETLVGAYVSQSRNPGRSERFSGNFHWQSNERHTKYSMACILADIAGIDKSFFVRVDDAPPPGATPRPQFERMLCTRLEGMLAMHPEGLPANGPDGYRSDFRAGMLRYLKPFLHDPKEEEDERLSKDSIVGEVFNDEETYVERPPVVSVGDQVQVYSRSHKVWLPARIDEVLHEDGQEKVFAVFEVENSICGKKMPSHSENLRLAGDEKRTRRLVSSKA